MESTRRRASRHERLMIVTSTTTKGYDDRYDTGIEMVMRVYTMLDDDDKNTH
jgi:hypothetical protein